VKESGENGSRENGSRENGWQEHGESVRLYVIGGLHGVRGFPSLFELVL
jgi:hypothetical protein